VYLLLVNLFGSGSRRVYLLPLLRELRKWVATSADYRNDSRHLYCVVIVGAGKCCVGHLNVGSRPHNPPADSR
jgi:hypothetical protein